MVLVSSRLLIPTVSASGSDMTDGAGVINGWSLKQIKSRLDLEDKPTAIQVRVFGAKVCVKLRRRRRETHTCCLGSPH